MDCYWRTGKLPLSPPSARAHMGETFPATEAAIKIISRMIGKYHIASRAPPERGTERERKREREREVD